MNRTGRLPTRKDRLEHTAFRGAIALLASLPRAQALRAGAAIGELLFRFDHRDRSVALVNLRIAFPEKTEGERLSILRASCHNLGRMAAEVCHMPRLESDNLGQYVTLADRGAWEAAMADANERGALVLSGHFGNWELLAHANGLLGHPVTLVHRPMRNPLVDEAIMRLRAAAGTRGLAKRSAAREAIRAVRRKELLVIPIDQNQSADLGVFVDFFGKPACTTTGLARLARLTGASVHPAFLVRQESGSRHVMEILPAVEWIDTGDRRRDVVVNTQRYTEIFEDVLRRHPEQWIWFHKRWRTRPRGEKQFY